MKRHVLAVALCSAALAPALLEAQASAAVPPAEQQIAAAVLPLPAEFRASARVLGYRAGQRGLVSLREGQGPVTCLASDPAGKQFHVACYHQSLEPFMARGRALRASGVTGDQVDTVRFAEVKSGKLAMPTHPASLYQLFGPPNAYDPATRTTKGARPLFIVYLPGATAESSGLSTKPAEGTPWLMFPGTPKAHIMLEPRM